MSSFVTVTPDLLTSAAADLAAIRATISEASAAAAAPTSSILLAAADEVSGAIAALFSGHAADFQALTTQAAAFHQRFVQLLQDAAAAYAQIECHNAQPLQYPTVTVGPDGSLAFSGPSPALPPGDPRIWWRWP